jgi:hypothetical protein
MFPLNVRDLILSFSLRSHLLTEIKLQPAIGGKCLKYFPKNSHWNVHGQLQSLKRR